MFDCSDVRVRLFDGNDYYGDEENHVETTCHSYMFKGFHIKEFKIASGCLKRPTEALLVELDFPTGKQGEF